MKTTIGFDGIRLLMEHDGSFLAMTSWLVVPTWVIILLSLILLMIGIVIGIELANKKRKMTKKMLFKVCCMKCNAYSDVKTILVNSIGFADVTLECGHGVCFDWRYKKDKK